MTADRHASVPDPLARFILRLSQPNTPVLPDIVRFAEDPEFLALPQPLYPRQKTFLRLVTLDVDHMTDYDRAVVDEWAASFYAGQDRVGVVPDVWDRVAWLLEHGYPHFREILNIGGRRGSKGHLGAILALHKVYGLLQHDCPQEYLGVDPDHDLYLFVSATNLAQARSNQFGDIKKMALRAPCFRGRLVLGPGDVLAFRTAHDERREAGRRAAGLPVGETASIKVVALSSNAPAVRGAASFMQIYDEMAHAPTGTSGPRTQEEAFHALTPSLDQSKTEALIYIGTSPYTQAGQCYEEYEHGLALDEDGRAMNPEILVAQFRSWDQYLGWDDLRATGGRILKEPPQVPSEILMAQERRNPAKFRTERLAQWMSGMDAYLDPDMVDRLFDPVCGTCGHSRQPGDDGCPLCGDAQPARILEPRDHGIIRWMYRGHADPSKSQASFAVAIGHAEPYIGPDGETWYHVFIDWVHVWRPADHPDHQIPYDQIEAEIGGVLARFPSLRVFSYDQYGSFVTVPRMRNRLRKTNPRTRVREHPFSRQENLERCEYFKTAIGMNWVHLYRDRLAASGGSLAEQELKFLRMTTDGNVVARTSGPVQTKDLADCIMVVSVELLRDQLERLDRREDYLPPIFAAAQGGYRSGITADVPVAARRREKGAMRRRLDTEYHGFRSYAEPPWQRRRFRE